MKPIVHRCGRQLAVVLYCVGLAVTGAAQSNNKPELIEREKEIEMALSAAPAHLRNKAEVYVLQRGGYVKAREGSNGFTCLVEREGLKDTAPICFDREGSETTLQMVLRKMRLIEQGKSEKEIERLIGEEYRTRQVTCASQTGRRFHALWLNSRRTITRAARWCRCSLLM